MPTLQNTSKTVDLTTGNLIGITVVSGNLQLASISGTSYYEDGGTAEFLGIDLGQKAVSSTLKLTGTKTLNGATLYWYTATSNDNITFTSYTAALSDGTIQSTYGRYLNVKLVYTGGRSMWSTTANNFSLNEASQFSATNITIDGDAYMNTYAQTATLSPDATWSGAGSLFRFNVDASAFSEFLSLRMT